MSETQNDPWGGVTRVDITTNQHGYEEYEWHGGYYYRADEVDRARADVEAAHQQEIARLARSRTEAIASAQRVYEQYSVVCERLDKAEAERDALAAQIAGLREALTIADTTAANLHDIIRERDRQVAELPALQQRSRWATFLERWIDDNFDAHGSDVAWNAFVALEHNAPPMHGCACAQCRAALAATEQGGAK